MTEKLGEAEESIESIQRIYMCEKEADKHLINDIQKQLNEYYDRAPTFFFYPNSRSFPGFFKVF